MNIRRIFSAILLTAIAGTAGARDAGIPSRGIAPVPANRIVGHWRADVALGSCAGGPAFVAFIGFNTFHAGGTLSDTNNTSPALRSPGHGTWKSLGNGQYVSRFQLFRFLPTGQYDGYADVQGTLTLDQAATSYSSEIRARNFNPDGTFRGELCGIAVGDRVAID